MYKYLLILSVDNDISSEYLYMLFKMASLNYLSATVFLGMNESADLCTAVQTGTSHACPNFPHLSLDQ